MVHQLTAATFAPGKLYPYPIDALPIGLQCGMPGLKDAYVSGYKNSVLRKEGLSGLGEFATIREDREKGKGYNYAFALSGDGKVYYAGPFKDFEDHHWEKNEPVPVDSLSGHFTQYIHNSLDAQMS
jgi:hypothetical protein